MFSLCAGKTDETASSFSYVPGFVPQPFRPRTNTSQRSTIFCHVLASFNVLKIMVVSSRVILARVLLTCIIFNLIWWAILGKFLNIPIGQGCGGVQFGYNHLAKLSLQYVVLLWLKSSMVLWYVGYSRVCTLGKIPIS